MRRSLRAAVFGALILAGGPASRADLFFSALAPEALGATGTGVTSVDFNPVTLLMRVEVQFSGLSGNTTVSHIHAATASPGTGTAGVATQLPTFSGFPAGVKSGYYVNTFDMSLAASWNATYVTNNGGTTASASAALLNAMRSGRAYLNVHSSTFTGGEIRGFLTAIPEPSPMLLGAVGGGLALAVRLVRSRKRS